MFALNVRAAVPARLVSGKKNDAPGFLVIPFKQCLALCANGLGSRVEQDHTRVAILFPARIALAVIDRKSTRLNSSHVRISYAVFCLKKKKTQPLEPERVTVLCTALR